MFVRKQLCLLESSCVCWKAAVFVENTERNNAHFILLRLADVFHDVTHFVHFRFDILRPLVEVVKALPIMPPFVLLPKRNPGMKSASDHMCPPLPGTLPLRSTPITGMAKEARSPACLNAPTCCSRSQ